jgi:hypothetical protein
MEIMLFAIPFVLAGKWSIALAKAKTNAWYGIILFVVTAAILSAIYARAYGQYRELIDKRMATAASMELGAAILFSLPVIILCWSVHWLLWPDDNTGPHAP